MWLNTTLGPFHKDDIFNACYLSHYFFLDHVIKIWTDYTNKYTNNNRDKGKTKEAKEHRILQFLSI